MVDQLARLFESHLTRGAKKGPDAKTRTGPPSLRDARELVCLNQDVAGKGENPVHEWVMRDSRGNGC